MSIYFTAKVSTITHYLEDSVVVHESVEQVASFELGNSSSLRCFLSSTDECCGSKLISGKKFVAGIEVAVGSLGRSCSVWNHASGLVSELVDGSGVSDTCKSYVGVELSWG